MGEPRLCHPPVLQCHPGDPCHPSRSPPGRAVPPWPGSASPAGSPGTGRELRPLPLSPRPPAGPPPGTAPVPPTGTAESPGPPGPRPRWHTWGQGGDNTGQGAHGARGDRDSPGGDGDSPGGTATPLGGQRQPWRGQPMRGQRCFVPSERGVAGTGWGGHSWGQGQGPAERGTRGGTRGGDTPAKGHTAGTGGRRLVGLRGQHGDGDTGQGELWAGG